MKRFLLYAKIGQYLGFAGKSYRSQSVPNLNACPIICVCLHVVSLMVHKENT